jgi:hypothetical protein
MRKKKVMRCWSRGGKCRHVVVNPKRLFSFVPATPPTKTLTVVEGLCDTAAGANAEALLKMKLAAINNFMVYKTVV